MIQSERLTVRVHIPHNDARANLDLLLFGQKWVKINNTVNHRSGNGFVDFYFNDQETQDIFVAALAHAMSSAIITLIQETGERGSTAEDTSHVQA